MPWYGTIYSVGPEAKYGDWLWAKDRRTATRRCKQRGAGEAILYQSGTSARRPYESPSQLLRKRKPPLTQIQHAVAWLAYIGLKSGRIGVDELLGDKGLVHLFAHWCQFGHKRGRSPTARVFDIHDRETIRECTPRVLARMAADIERRIPGYCGPKG